MTFGIRQECRPNDDAGLKRSHDHQDIIRLFVYNTNFSCSSFIFADTLASKS